MTKEFDDVCDECDDLEGKEFDFFFKDESKSQEKELDQRQGKESGVDVLSRIQDTFMCPKIINNNDTEPDSSVENISAEAQTEQEVENEAEKLIEENKTALDNLDAVLKINTASRHSLAAPKPTVISNDDLFKEEAMNDVEEIAVEQVSAPVDILKDVDAVVSDDDKAELANDSLNVKIVEDGARLDDDIIVSDIQLPIECIDSETDLEDVQEQAEQESETASLDSTNQTIEEEDMQEDLTNEEVTEIVIKDVKKRVDGTQQTKMKKSRRDNAAEYAEEVPYGGDGMDSDGIIFKTIDEVMHESMIPYSEFVIMDRALPRVEDGLKPVQRRILYSMFEMGLEPDKPFRKSAGIVGDCLGKYHPHGDKSVYDAMVRLAQPFNLNMPLVTGQGNFGSDDGDGAAAMRYTEAKLAPLALELLRDIDKETVPFSLTFDDRNTEPDILPGRYPNLLVNGASGIAVGLATNIPPHNLGEVIDGVVAVIDKPSITLHEIMKIIKGPDFPTSAFIVGGEDLVRAYKTGKGKVAMRAKIHIEVADNGNKSIVINDLPYQVNKVNLQQKIAHLREEKKGALSLISEIRDESDRKGTRIVIRLRKEADPKAICNLLFKYTDLQCNFNINIVAIAGGKPMQLGLLEILRYYVEYQREIIFKRSKFDLEAAKEKAHILEGLLIAIRNIDEVVKIIKTSKNTAEAKTRLKERFKLSDRQAQAILDLRLAKLTSLEVFKLEDELSALHKLIKELTAIVNSKKLQFDVVKAEILEIKRKFRVDRRSKIVKAFDDNIITSDDDAKPVFDCVIACTKSGGMKRLNLKSYSQSSTEATDKTTVNEVHSTLISCKSNKMLYIFTNRGNCYKLEAEYIPDSRWRDRGMQFKSLIKDAEVGELPVAIYPIEQEKLPAGEIVFFTKLGMIKRSSWAEYGIIKNTFQAIKLREGDEVISITENSEAHNSIMFVTKNGMALNAETKDVPIQGRVATGVRGVNLADDDYCVLADFAPKQCDVLVVTNRGYAKKMPIKEFDVMARYRKGIKAISLDGKDNGNEVMLSCVYTEPTDVLVECENNKICAVNTAKIDKQSRTGKGKRVKGLKASDSIVAAYKFNKTLIKY